MRAFGVPLRTTESEVAVAEPGEPDIRVARILDRNWELLSLIVPVWTIHRAVHRHFRRAISRLIYQSISRLTTQWEEAIHAALRSLEREALRRLDELIGTLEGMLGEDSRQRGNEIRAGLAEIARIRQSLRAVYHDRMSMRRTQH